MVERAWLQGISGCGSVVAIVDDGMPNLIINSNITLLFSHSHAGLDYNHPDLRANYVSKGIVCVAVTH